MTDNSSTAPAGRTDGQASRQANRQTGESVVIGIDVGGTKILIGAVDRTGTVHRQKRYAMDRSNQTTVLRSIRDAVGDYMRPDWFGPQPVAMGIGVVGQTDPASGVWLQAMNVPIRTPVPLADELERRYGLPVAIDNDVHAATIAEMTLGAGRSARDFVYLNVGTGLAAGVVSNGRLIRGASNYAGELGHMKVEEVGEPCTCGRSGCLEPIASGGGMLAQVRAQLDRYPSSTLHHSMQSDALTAGAIFSAADAGDALATAIAQRAVRALGNALTNLVNLLNPQLIVYGGGVLGDGWMMQRVTGFLSHTALPAAYAGLRDIVPSPLHVDTVGLLGAASLAWGHLSNIAIDDEP